MYYIVYSAAPSDELWCKYDKYMISFDMHGQEWQEICNSKNVKIFITKGFFIFLKGNINNNYIINFD